MQAEMRAVSAPTTMAAAVVELLAELGVTQAYGVSGGAIASLWDALCGSSLEVMHCRHETGAAFAATEAHFASGRPSALFTTAGPGLTNALTGVIAARDEGAKLIVLSAHSSAAQLGRFAIQETSAATLPPTLYRPGRPFHFATIIDGPGALQACRGPLRHGFRQPGGFLAHLALDTSVQRQAAGEGPAPGAMASHAAPALRGVERCLEALGDGDVALWVGFGARAAAAEVTELAHRLRAPVMCSPRAKGIFPEDDELFVGVTGLGGHTSVLRLMTESPPRRMLILGSRLGEPTSFWDPRFVPAEGFIHVDIDPGVVGAAYPKAASTPIVADIASLLREVLERLPSRPASVRPTALPRPEIEAVEPRSVGLVRPQVLMEALQRRVVDETQAIVLAESGNSFLWTTHCLRFRQPGRYRISTGVGAMGHAAAGVVGAALGSGRRAVAVVGDGALLMQNEINAAVKYGARATWIVLNDARYGICAQGMQVNFAALAYAQGAQGIVVRSELELDDALREALRADGPCVVDVQIDADCRAPADLRNASLASTQRAPRRAFPVG